MNNLPIIREFSDKFELTERHGESCGEIDYSEVFNFAIEFAKLHVKAALKAASEKAERKMTTGGWCNACNRGTTYINESSILNAYPDDLIQ